MCIWYNVVDMFIYLIRILITQDKNYHIYVHNNILPILQT